MVSIFEDIFGRHISGTGGQINFFFGKWFYSDKSSIPKNEKKFELVRIQKFQFCLILVDSDPEI